MSTRIYLGTSRRKKYQNVLKIFPAPAVNQNLKKSSQN
jgi:hypothetical protein